MRLFLTVFGLSGVLLAGAAHATPGPGKLAGTALYSSFLTNAYDSNSVVLHAPVAGTQGGSPDAQEFYAPSATTITNIWFRLAGGTAPAGGSLLVYLVGNGSNNLPSASGLTLTNDTLLGSIAESSLTTAASNILFTPTVGTGVISAPGNYWIALIDNATSDTVAWERAGDLIGVDGATTNAGLYNSHIQNSNGTLTMVSVNTNAFEMQINVADPVSTPEPAGLAVLGLGMVGLGVAKRYRIRQA